MTKTQALLRCPGYSRFTIYDDGGIEYWDAYGGPTPDGFNERPERFYVAPDGVVRLGGFYGEVIGKI